jgi:hypothetical protein
MQKWQVIFSNVQFQVFLISEKIKNSKGSYQNTSIEGVGFIVEIGCLYNVNICQNGSKIHMCR